MALGAHSSVFLEQKKLYLNAIEINDQYYEQRIIRILVSFVYYFPSISTRKNLQQGATGKQRSFNNGVEEINKNLKHYFN